MSELIQKTQNQTSIRWSLLAGVSALALAAHLSSPVRAATQDGDHPTVWIELGGQLNRLDDGSEPYEPAFTAMRPSNFSPSRKFEKAPLYGLEEVGKISVQPEGSGWVFSAGVHFGRSSIGRHVRQQDPFADPQAYTLTATAGTGGYHPYRAAVAAHFADTTAQSSEQHVIADFQAGKDVGLGLFGGHGSSVFGLGVRYAQFTGKSNVALKSDPDWRFKSLTKTIYGNVYNGLAQPYHSNAAGLVADRSFRGIGPSVSWNASTPLSGDDQDAELNFDWGVNAALLFGRQKSRTQHHETMRYNDGGYGLLLGYFFGVHPSLATVYRNTPAPHIRSRSVVVPNIGGFAGLSFKYAAAKVSFGYRGDFFFGAMDGGIDARKTYGRNFYGPYATISIGLGG